jgi:AcrR family transcriptional regulator
VARTAGFSVGSLYQYFDDKQAVVGALIDQALREEAERIAVALGETTALEPAAACDRALRTLLAERHRKAHLLRTLDAFAPELCPEPPLRHVLRVQGGTLAEPLHRFAAAHFGDALRGAFEEGLAVAARFVHALGYALAVDAPEHIDDETIARGALAALMAAASRPAPASALARGLQAAWAGGSGAAFADAAARARRVRETRSALVCANEVPPPALEPTVFLLASLGEAAAELRDEPALGLDPGRVAAQTTRLAQACLDSAPG